MVDMRTARVRNSLAAYVCRHHVDRVDPTVAHRDARQRDDDFSAALVLRARIVGVDVGGKAGDIVAAVRFARDEQLLLEHLREDAVELRQQRVEVARDAHLGVIAVAALARGEAEAGADRVVDEEHRVLARPRRVALHEPHRGVRVERAHLGKEPEHARAARAALQPDEERRVLLGEVPPEH
eukprot:1260925-Prymnesium_polylepis.1